MKTEITFRPVAYPDLEVRSSGMLQNAILLLTSRCTLPRIRSRHCFTSHWVRPHWK